ncbi:MAG: malonate--CoA ligase [Pikeienuella sp.]
MANPLYDALFGRHEGKTTPFLIRPDGRTVSHDEFLKTAARYAHAIQAAGLAPGDRLAAQVVKSPEALAVYAGCVAAGVVCLPLNTAYTPAEISYFLENSGAKLMLADKSAIAPLTPVADAAGAKLMALNADGSGDFAEAGAGAPDRFDPVTRADDDLAAFLYTSGTTGRSKGAMLTQRNLLSNAEALTESWRFTSSDVLLHALPIVHTPGLFVATNIMALAGGAMIFLPKFDLDEIIRLTPQATSMMGVPTFYTRLLDDARFTKALTTHMRLFTSGSAPLLAETHRAFEERTGHRILERYGMTETNMNTSNPYEGERRAGTVGFPLPGVELKVTDPETGEALPEGEVGVIEVRGANVFKGYWGMPEKTKEELREDGFFITGDLGLIDDRGYVQIVGRGKDLIISGGFNVYPKEVELVLDEQPGVLESAVVAAPHPDFGEAVVGFLVALPGETPDLGAIDAALREKLARYKQPKKLIVTAKLPRNTMGKVQKNLLRDEVKGLFA